MKFNEPPDDYGFIDTIEFDLEQNFEGEEYGDVSGIPRKFTMFEIFNNIAREKMHPNIKDSSLFAYLGEKRSGKSNTAIAQGFAIDPDFNVDHICFSFDELKDFIYSHTKTSAVWDESGVTAYNRDALTKANKGLNKFFQVFGFRQIAVICTFQHLQMLDVQTRLQLDAMFWNQSRTYNDQETFEPYTRKYSKPYKIMKNPFSFPLIKPYKITKREKSSPEEIGWIPIPKLPDLFKLYKIRKSVLDQYEKKKMDFFIEMGDKEDLKLNKRQLAVIARQQAALKTTVNNLMIKHGMSKSKVSEILEIPRPTLTDWGMFDSLGDASEN